MRRHRIHVSRCGGMSETVAREVGGRLRERRKEVALGRLRILAIPLILGAWGAATDGAPPNEVAPATSPTRPPAPVPPVKYLEAGAKLFNNGQSRTRVQVPQGRAEVSRPAHVQRTDRARLLPPGTEQGAVRVYCHDRAGRGDPDPNGTGHVRAAAGRGAGRVGTGHIRAAAGRGRPRPQRHRPRPGRRRPRRRSRRHRPHPGRRRPR